MARFRISGRPSEVAAIDAALAELIELHAGWLNSDERMAARLGLHELLINVTRHAYLGSGGVIDVEVFVTAESLAINVADSGRPCAASLSGELPERPSTSGYGIPIILATYDDARYCRSARRNHWALRLYRYPRADARA